MDAYDQAAASARKIPPTGYLHTLQIRKYLLCGGNPSRAVATLKKVIDFGRKAEKHVTYGSRTPITASPITGYQQKRINAESPAASDLAKATRNMGSTRKRRGGFVPDRRDL